MGPGQPLQSGAVAEDRSNQQECETGQQCVDAACDQDQDVIMVDAEEPAASTEGCLSVAQLAAQAGQAASFAAR
jgi:hypothetical protein